MCKTIDSHDVDWIRDKAVYALRLLQKSLTTQMHCFVSHDINAIAARLDVAEERVFGASSHQEACDALKELRLWLLDNAYPHEVVLPLRIILLASLENG